MKFFFRNDVGLLIGAGASAVSVSRAIAPAVGGFLFDLNPEFPTLFCIVVALSSYYISVTQTPKNHKHYTVSGNRKEQVS